MTAPPDPRVGTDLGPYHIEAVIGRGGMGVVYRAVDRSLDRPAALKLIAPTIADDGAFQSRFLRESKMAAAIDHPNILPIYEAGELGGVYFLAMRYVDGTDLERRLLDGPLEPRAAVTILAQIASALDAAHAAGLVHRDVKPANVLIASGQGADRSDHAYLTDFGLTKQSGSETGLTRAGGFVGTLEYIAPEQIEGKPASGRSDQYALAGVAVACLTGRVPFPRVSDVAMINAHLHDPPPSLHDRVGTLPSAVDAVVACGLAKAPDERYPDCRAFAEDLAWALGVTAPRPEIDLSRPSANRRSVATVGVLLGVGLLAAVGFALASGGGAISSPSPPASPAGVLPSPSAEASPSEDVFPNAAEAALRQRLPQALRASCSRGPYSTIGGMSGFATAVASLNCQPDIGAGTSSLLVRQYPPSGGRDNFVAGVMGSIAAGFDEGVSPQGVIGGDGNPLNPGDCAKSPRASGRWSLAGVEMGAIACYTLSSSGDAYLWWSYDQQSILVRVTNQRGDWKALYRYFNDVARFIAP